LADDSERSEVAHLLADLADRLLLQLTDSLARQVVLVADLFESQLVFVVEPNSRNNAGSALSRLARSDRPNFINAPRM
jgi:hypothetical protein